MTRAKCHICKEVRDCAYCSLCEHWFCAGCNGRWAARGLEALKQFVGGRKPGCCGPTKPSAKRSRYTCAP